MSQILVFKYYMFVHRRA